MNLKPTTFLDDINRSYGEVYSNSFFTKQQIDKLETEYLDFKKNTSVDNLDELTQIILDYPILNNIWQISFDTGVFTSTVGQFEFYNKNAIRLFNQNIQDPWYREFPKPGKLLVTSYSSVSPGNLKSFIYLTTTVNGLKIHCYYQVKD